MKGADFIENFEIIAEAPDGIQEMRKFILESAIRGQVSNKHDSDSDVSDLYLSLCSIVRKNSKRNSPNNCEKALSHNFDLPSSWMWMSLGEVGKIFNGNSTSKAKKEELAKINDGHPYLATKDIGYGLDPFNYNTGLLVPFDEKKFKVAKAETVFVCAEGGSAGRKMGLSDRSICFGNKLYAIEAYPGIDPKYVLYYCMSPTFYSFFADSMTGIIGGISKSRFMLIPIPVPPLEEQKRIVSKIDHLMALCDELEVNGKKRNNFCVRGTEASLDSLLKAQDSKEFHSCWERVSGEIGKSFENVEALTKLGVLIRDLGIQGRLVKLERGESSVSDLIERLHVEQQHAKELGHIKKIGKFSTGPVSVIHPSHWRVVSLADVIIYGPRNGYSPKGVDYPTPVKAITLSATTSGKFDGSKFKYIDEDISIDSHLWLNEEDVLFQRGNSLEYVGMAAVYKGKSHEYIYPDLMMKVRLASCLDISYLQLIFLSSMAREYLQTNASGTSGSMPKINQGTLLSLPIPLPPIEEQKRIVERVNELSQLCEKYRKSLIAKQKITNEFARTAASYVINCGGANG